MDAVVSRSLELPDRPQLPADLPHILHPFLIHSPIPKTDLLSDGLSLPSNHPLRAGPPRPRRLLGARTHRPAQQRARIVDIYNSSIGHRRRSPRVAGGGLGGPRPRRGETEAHQLERVGGPDRARGRWPQPVSAAGGAVWVLGCAGEEEAVCGLGAGGGSVEAVIMDVAV